MWKPNGRLRFTEVATKDHSPIFKPVVHRILVMICASLLPFLTLADIPIYSERAIIHPVIADQAMVVSEEATATGVGLDILKQGGNAVDAAVAMGFTLAVTLPRAGNLGGGGFMLVYDAKTQKTIAIDFRETAPSAATRDMFLDERGEVDPNLSRYSYLAVGVPGTVAGLALALERYGTLPLAQVIAPAIRLAEEGITVTQELSYSLKTARKRLQPWPASRQIFFKADGSPYEPGETLQQKQLAGSLKAIAKEGPEAFYSGEIAQKIVADMTANGGLITLEDLENYRALIRKPVRGQYRGYRIASMPPPSSGGVHLLQILNILEHYPISVLGHNSAATLHRMTEAMKLAYADRSEYLGDPAFVDIPAKLTSKDYADQLLQQIDSERARPADEIRPGGAPVPIESPDTTHFSVVDTAGNAVATTYTINFSYGSGITAAGTGILLNNEMDDFSAKPGVPNAYGLIGGDANAVEGGKRPLSSMTPTLVFKDGNPFLVTGSPGGSQIITTVLQTIMNVIDHDMNIAAATIAPRVHHQWLPDELRVEQSLNPDTIAALKALGHVVKISDAMGATQSIVRLSEGITGFSDTRRPGGLAAGY